MSKKKQTVVVTLIASSLLLSGCGLFGGEEQAQVDPPQDVTYTDEEEVLQEWDAGNPGEEEGADQEGEAADTTLQTLYLIDNDGFVVPQTVEMPITNSVAQQALDYLVAGGPITQELPEGFRAVLPEGTVSSIDVNEGVATVDFSTEFTQYMEEDEKRIVQAVTWTLTEFDSIDRVKFTVNGNEQTEMPVASFPLDDAGMSRADGINLDSRSFADITGTSQVTVYYLGQNDEGQYYQVPVTTRIDKSLDPVTATIAKLVEGPAYTSSNLVSEFLTDVELVEAPIVEDGLVTLNFNEALLAGNEEGVLSSRMLQSIVLSLTEQKSIKEVSIQVAGESEFVNENGESVAEPVSRPENVNTSGV
ncbi:GerMN domain-containing protein [Bacillus fonticola]|uniref:GerMN domain-containing protein n=1 Tax=Bacillus fonticola TaxID=2728853 RepID=UPI0014761E05|nr:GerMN domain-containing protein [Bacillus fonticola]